MPGGKEKVTNTWKNKGQASFYPRCKISLDSKGTPDLFDSAHFIDRAMALNT
ncbi:MAG: hypothetical protein Q8O43_10740 [Dehalococcoidia bacterium]|nr:hypothetical protein [Dehalococcoidia bacterium]